MVGVQKDGGGSHATTPRPTASTGTQRLQVTPENVVELAVTFRQIAERYEAMMAGLRRNLTLHEPWLGDPFSQWAKDEFNGYFVDNENSVANTIEQMRNQYNDMYQSMQKIAEQYGKTDELNKRMMEQQGPTA